MKKAELLKHIPKRQPKGSTAKIIVADGQKVLMISGKTNTFSLYQMGKSVYLYHFTWATSWITYNPQEKIWSRDCAGTLGIDITRKKDIDICSKFTGRQMYYGDPVIQYEEDLRSRLNEKAQERKQKRIDKIMECVPALPHGFIQTIRKFYKPNKTVNVKLFQPATDGRSVERMFKIEDDCDGDMTISEIARAFTDGYGNCWDTWYFGNSWKTYGKRQHFWDRKGLYGLVSILPRSYRLYDNLNSLDMTEAQRSTLRLTDQHCKGDPSILLNILHSNPDFEKVVKLGLYRASAEALMYRSSGKYIINTVKDLTRQQAERAVRLDLGIDCMDIMRQHPNITDQSLMEINKIRSEYKMSSLNVLFQKPGPASDVYRDRRFGLNPNHVITLLLKTGGTTLPNITMYSDYLDMARNRHMDIHDEIVYRNKRWREFHDRYFEEENARLQAQRDARLKEELKQKKKKYARIRKDLKRNTRIFGWTDGTYQTIIPASTDDFVKEGTEQHHCVGASDTYVIKMATRKSWIIFLRKCEDPKKAWYTIETDGNRVLQAYSAYDRQPDIKDVNKILARWMKSVRKNKAKVEKEEAARLSKKAILAVAG